MSLYRTVFKRCFDLTASLIGIIVVIPMLILIAIIVRLDSRGPILFRQQRVGRGLKAFEILKFRTMVPDAPVWDQQ